MPHTTHCAPVLIQADAADPIWEWHVPTDSLFLSSGACQALGLDAVHPPRTMANFLEHIPPDCHNSLSDLREGAITGASGPFLETIYPLDDQMVRERMIVVERDNHDRAVRMVGHFSQSRDQGYQPPLCATQTPHITGFWHWNVAYARIQIDGRCAELLGYTDALPRSFSLAEWAQRLHPDEGHSFDFRYQLTVDQPQMGDSIDDIFRLRLESGEYARFSLQGSVLTRNSDGLAQELMGRLRQIGAFSTQKQREIPDTGRLLLAINASGDGLWDWDSTTDSVYYSPRYLSMLGYTAEQFPGNLEVWKEKIHPDDLHKIVPPQAALVDSPRYGDTFECTYRIRRADDRWAWILGRGYVTHRNAEGKATRLVGLHTDITATQNERAELEDLVKNDALTGLRSRAFFNQEVERIEHTGIRPVGIIACDINGLKLINDYMGHAVGDNLLRETALLLRRALRATDCVARMGGDEFTMLLPGCTLQNTQSILQQTIQQFREHNNAANDMPILPAFGFTCVEDANQSLAAGIITADRNMLRRKKEQRVTAHGCIKSWLETTCGITVSLEDNRYS